MISIVVVTAFSENASGPLFSPSNTLADSPFGHVDIHASRVLHQKEHPTVAGEQDNEKEVKAAVADYEGVASEHQEDLASLTNKGCLSNHCSREKQEGSQNMIRIEAATGLALLRPQQRYLFESVM